MQKIKALFLRVRGWSLRKKIFVGVLLIIVVLILAKVFSPEDLSKKVVSETVKKIDLKKTVLATGQVTSDTNLKLSFYSSGIVRKINANVGDKVYKGQVLATLEQGNEVAALTQANASLQSAQAKYEKLLAGYSSEEITLSEVALQNAKLDYDRAVLQQDVLVSNAYNNLLNSTLEAIPSSGSSSLTAPSVSGTYNSNKEGDIVISTFATGNGTSFNINGIINGSGVVSTNNPQPVGETGLYILFSSLNSSNIGEWTIAIPNKKASNYLTNYNAYQAALKTKDSALGSALALINQREAELAIKRASATAPNVDIAKADILLAEGQVQNATANLEHKILRAPASGTITKIDIKVGELAQSLAEAMALEDVNNLYLEANINEANIVDVTLGSLVDITFDAFGEDKVNKGKVIEVDPSSTLVSGVVNYKIKASVEGVEGLKPGMTANMTILVGEKEGVLTVPTRAVLEKDDGSKVVRMITDTKRKSYEERNVTTGFSGDGGMIEIISGLSEGQEVVSFINK